MEEMCLWATLHNVILLQQVSGNECVHLAVRKLASNWDDGARHVSPSNKSQKSCVIGFSGTANEWLSTESVIYTVGGFILPLETASPPHLPSLSLTLSLPNYSPLIVNDVTPTRADNDWNTVRAA